MPGGPTFQRRGIVEGFFGPPWSMRQRSALFRFGAKRGMNTFVYAFHPGKGLGFSAPEPVHVLLGKAARFYDAGVQTFAVLFDDIPSRLEHEEDRKQFNGSLAKAQGLWLGKHLERH